MPRARGPCPTACRRAAVSACRYGTSALRCEPGTRPRPGPERRLRVRLGAERPGERCVIPGVEQFPGPLRGNRDRIASRAASGRCACASRAPGPRSQAATGRRIRAGWCGGIARPSGKSPPVSSNRMTPLHSRLHPCSGWKAMVWAASRSERSAGGHGDRCGHMASLWIRSCGRTWTAGPCWQGAGPSW